MNKLIGIQKTNDILQFKDEIYASDTELQRAMTCFEEGNTNEGPQLEPMRINWKVKMEGGMRNYSSSFLHMPKRKVMPRVAFRMMMRMSYGKCFMLELNI